jgi:hypothetical protein
MVTRVRDWLALAEGWWYSTVVWSRPVRALSRRRRRAWAELEAATSDPAWQAELDRQMRIQIAVNARVRELEAQGKWPPTEQELMARIFGPDEDDASRGTL